MPRKSFAAALLLLLIMGAGASLACKKTGPYPSREIEFVIPFPPGGPADTAARIIQPKMSELLGVPVMVVNKPGGGGALAAEAVAKSPADGYHVLATSNSVFTVLPATSAKLGYSLGDFTPLGTYLSDWSIVAVQAGSPWKSLEQLVEYAKKNPGKLHYGSPGEGTASGFAMKQIEHFYELEMTHAPLVGAAAVMQALLAGQVQVVAAGMASFASLLESGELRPLVITAEDRLSKYPDLPTMYEKGIADFPLPDGMGLFVPAATQKAAVDRLSAALALVMQDSAVFSAADAAGLAVDYSNPDATRRQLQSESAMIRAAAEEFRVKNQVDIQDKN